MLPEVSLDSEVHPRAGDGILKGRERTAGTHFHFTSFTTTYCNGQILSHAFLFYASANDRRERIFEQVLTI